MNNILSYLSWRGDLTLNAEPFNEVDSLVLSEFAYIDFMGFVPLVGEIGAITIADAYAGMVAKKNNEVVKALSNVSEYMMLFERLAGSARFSNAYLSQYIDLYCEEERVQFSAMQIGLDDGSSFIAFRGTDQTILGWREDFAMSFEVVAAQRQAVQYFSQIIQPEKKYRLGGHSKGGNLAVYAAMNLNEIHQNQIIDIYNLDGPGFCPEVFPVQLYETISNRVHQIVPEFCIIGNLYGQNGTRKIIHSEREGILQHEGFSWVVESNHFVETDDLLPECKELNSIIDSWVDDVGMEQRPVFVDDFFGALAAGGAKNINEVAKNGAGGFEAILSAMLDSDKKSKSVITKLFKAAIARLQNINFAEIFKTKHIIRGIMLLLVGLFFIKLPGAAVEVIATAGVFVVSFFAIFRLIHYIKRIRHWNSTGKYSVVFYSLLIAILTLFALMHSVFLISMHFALGILCCAYGFANLNKAMRWNNRKQVLFWVTCARSAIFIALGLVVLVALGQDMSSYNLVIGSFLMLDGIAEVIVGNYRRIKQRA